MGLEGVLPDATTCEHTGSARVDLDGALRPARLLNPPGRAALQCSK
jgi:hypothetical protein